MRMIRLATVAVVGIAALPAMAQTSATPVPNVAAPSSNITAANTKSVISPNLPAPAVAGDASAQDYLRAARLSLVAGRTGQAQQALEMAQTRMLDRSVVPSAAGTPSDNRVVLQIAEALQAVGNGQREHAIQIIDGALAP